MRSSPTTQQELFAFPDLGLAKYRQLTIMWTFVTLASFATPVLLGASAFFVIMPIALFNLLVYCKTTGKISAHAPSLYYIGPLASFCKRTRKLRGSEGSEELERLASIYPKTKRVAGPSAFLKPVTSFGGNLGKSFLLYIKVFMLVELSSYLKAAEAIRDSGSELRSLYETAGTIDAYCSLAVLAKEDDAPVSANVTIGIGRIEAAEARHSLVASATRSL
jgi:hypothetical protein